MLRTNIKCPKCGSHNIDISYPYHNHIIWYDCEDCGEEWDGEEPVDSTGWYIDNSNEEPIICDFTIPHSKLYLIYDSDILDILDTHFPNNYEIINNKYIVLDIDYEELVITDLTINLLEDLQKLNYEIIRERE